MRSQGIARGALWGVDGGWVVHTASRSLLNSFSGDQDSSTVEHRQLKGCALVPNGRCASTKISIVKRMALKQTCPSDGRYS